MGKDLGGRRVAYDRMWGTALALTIFLPTTTEEGSQVWNLVRHETNPVVLAWLIVGSLGGVVAMCVGFMAMRSRWRHFANYAFGVATLVLPWFAPSIWERFPYANPAKLPLREFGAVGWVMLVGIMCVYAGSGIRVVRPSQIAGQALGGLGAFLLVVFAFLPADDDALASFGATHLKLFADFKTHWRELVPFTLIAAGVLCGIVNLVRSKLEIVLAKLTRLLLVAGLLFWIVLPFVENPGEADTRLARHLPVAWGSLRLLAPLFLSLDGCIAFLAISITRSND